MTASTEGTPEWTLQQLRWRADAEVPGATERKVHTALSPDGVLVMAYCRDEGLEIVADLSGGTLAMQVNGDPVTPLIERAVSGDRVAKRELEVRFSPAQLAALAGVMDVVTANAPPRPTRRRIRWTR